MFLREPRGTHGEEHQRRLHGIGVPASVDVLEGGQQRQRPRGEPPRERAARGTVEAPVAAQAMTISVRPPLPIRIPEWKRRSMNLTSDGMSAGSIGGQGSSDGSTSPASASRRRPVRRARRLRSPRQSHPESRRSPALRRWRPHCRPERTREAPPRRRPWCPGRRDSTWGRRDTSRPLAASGTPPRRPAAQASGVVQGDEDLGGRRHPHVARRVPRAVGLLVAPSICAPGRAGAHGNRVDRALPDDCHARGSEPGAMTAEQNRPRSTS